MGTILVAERFGGGLTEADKRQLFDEHIQWYRMYGMSMRPVPESWEEFGVYWDHMCRKRFRGTTTRREPCSDLTKYDKLPIAPWASGSAVGRPCASCPRRSFAWLTVGLYHPGPSAKRMGYQWSGRDEWLHRRFGNLVRLIFAFVPPRYRKHPRAPRRSRPRIGAPSRPTPRCHRRPGA